MRTPRRQRAVVLALALAMMVTSACGDRPDPLDLGFKRVSLDLVFKDAAKAPPVDTQKVIKVVEYFDQEYGPYEEFEEETDLPRRRIPRVTREPEFPPCDTAPAGEVPLIPALSAVKDPPREGSFRRKNTGSIGLDVPGLFAGALPYPPFSTWTVTGIETDVGTLATNPGDDEDLPLDQVPRANPEPRADLEVTPEVYRFQLTRNIGPTTKSVDTYQYYGDRGTLNAATTEYDGDGIYLVKRETFSETVGNTVFEPTPPVMITAIGDEHEDAADADAATGISSEEKRSSGVDRTTGAAMTVQSKIVSREDIDVCGEVIGTYRVEFDEILVEGGDGSPRVSGTVETQKKNVWNITFNQGLHIVREEVHRVDHLVTQSGVPATVSFDYTSTLMNMEPEPLEGGPR